MTHSMFVAFPSSAPAAVEAIRNAVHALRLTHNNQVSCKTWEELDIPGRFIATEVLLEID